jgi:hypothetical protein
VRRAKDALGGGTRTGASSRWWAARRGSCARGRDDVSRNLFLLAPVEEKLRFDMPADLRTSFLVLVFLVILCLLLDQPIA